MGAVGAWVVEDGAAVVEPGPVEESGTDVDTALVVELASVVDDCEVNCKSDATRPHKDKHVPARRRCVPGGSIDSLHVAGTAGTACEEE